MKRELITFENVTDDIVDDIYLNGYLCSEAGELRGSDIHLSFISYICSLVQSGWFDKSEIQPIIQQFVKLS